ncbi:hypothetical protein LWI29_032472 [Acer saccharum]|uniref:Uncharacterized protein n=1 Tax=Acer saccharum TaxID=4024 RepID=A0AA39SFK0_ACESA|nr:hypothetical protein LWI29_032472 [Acer saccharum]KAK1566670.1 hypothetical protein Q3G72_002625 [Acer saccharum]
MPEQTPTTPENVDELLEAAGYDDINDVISLASSGVPLHSKDSQGRTALHMAAANAHLGIVEYLNSRGVDVNASKFKRGDRRIHLFIGHASNSVLCMKSVGKT